MVRDTLTARNELVDVLLKVTDETSAKTVVDNDFKAIQKRWDEKIKKRLDDQQRKINAQEKALKRAFDRLPESRQNQIKNAKQGLAKEDVGISSDLLETFDEYDSAQEAVKKRAEELEATAKRLNTQLDRIDKLVQQLQRQNPGANRDERWPSLIAVLKYPEYYATFRDLESGASKWDAPFQLAWFQLKKIPPLKR
ncbi:MAG TPA: hypothetical protein VGX70_14310 [Gemmataceae bacterium]|nr:hypothetical protein [Gemmataceae bacterium]